MRFIRVFLLIVLLGVLGACSRGSTTDDSAYTMTLSTQPSALKMGPAQVTVTILDPQSSPVTGATVSLEGTMSHAGMMPANADTTEVRPGEYQGTLDLSMGGEWLVQVTAKLPDGKTIERTLPLGNVSP